MDPWDGRATGKSSKKNRGERGVYLDTIKSVFIFTKTGDETQVLTHKTKSIGQSQMHGKESMICIKSVFISNNFYISNLN